MCQSVVGLQIPLPQSIRCHSLLEAKLFCMEQESYIFLVPPVVPQIEVAISTKAENLSQEKGIEKAPLPSLLYLYIAVSRVLPRHGTKPIFIADEASCVCQREAALQKTHWQVQPFLL